MDMYVSCVEGAEHESGLTFVVDSIFKVTDGQRDTKFDSLQVACESDDWNYWKMTFHNGDSVELKLEEILGASRGWLFGGGHGEVVMVSSPDSGIAVDCDCNSKSDKLRRRIDTAILDSIGHCASSIELTGESASFLARLVFKKGKKATIPSTLILRCNWMAHN